MKWINSTNIHFKSSLHYNLTIAEYLFACKRFKESEEMIRRFSNLYE